MRENRVWFIGNQMYTGDEAESLLNESIIELNKLKKHMIEQNKLIADILKDIPSANDETFQTKFNLFIELSEKLSCSTFIVEELYDYLQNHGF